MPNTHSTLTSLFTDIADAIREKDGSTAPIVADAFPAAVRAIPSGGEDWVKPIIERTISGSYTNLSASVVGAYAFARCDFLTSVSFPLCTTIGSNAFASCRSLTTPSFPACTVIGSNAFYSCSNLTTFSFPVCTTIGSNAFAYCTSLTTVSFPACTTIESSAFYSCARLTTFSFPVCTTIGSNAFGYCNRLTTFSFPVCTTLYSNAFNVCSNLTTASFPVCKMIGSSAFYRCFNLLSLYLLNSSVATLGNSNAFSSTPIAGYTASTGGVYGSIFVRASLLSDWQAKTNWTYFSSRFVGLTDEQIAALEG